MVFVATQEAARHMSPGGRVITIGSVNADRVPFDGGSVYAMTKGAVAGSRAGWPGIWVPAGSPSTRSSPGRWRPR